MRNLKRALSLAMASIMILGLMVVGAGAVSNGDFSDKDKIVNTEAVSVLTTLNVIAGREDGSFDPTGVVTRGEMAKMLCVVLNGGKDPQLGNITANFADTKGHWAESFIAYCANLNIIAGKGNGNFEPNATVTGSEAAKMLLVALGYNASVEGYVGANWQINVDVAANQKGLYDGLGTLNTTNGLTRDNAAQMVYNALDITTVEYSYVITGTADNSLTTKPQVTSKDRKTLLEEKFGAIKVEGIVVANEFSTLSSSKTGTDYATKGQVIGSAQDAGKTIVSITNTDAQNKFSGNETFTLTTGMDELGRKISIYVKPSSTALKSTVIGSAIVSDENKVVTDYSGDKIVDVADDNDLELVNSTIYAYNYGNSAKVLADAEKAVKTGVEKIMIDSDDDGEVNYVLLNTYQLGKVASTSTKDKGSINVTLNGTEGAFKMDNSSKVVGFDDVAKDDMVLTAFIGGRLYVEVAETVTGKIEAYKLNGKGEYTTGLTVDGTVYTVSRVPTIEVNDITAAATVATKTMIDSSATFYLDKQGYIIAQGEVKETAYNYAFVWDTNSDTVDGDRVKVTLSDGTTGAYNLHTDSVTPVGKSIYAYTLSSNGNTIKLLKATGGAVSGTTPVFEKGKSTVKISSATTEYNNNSNVAPSAGGTYYANNSTVFFYVTLKDGSTDVKKVTTHVGRNTAPTLDNTTAANEVYVALGRTDAGAVAFTGVSSKESAGDHLFLYSAGRVYNDYTEAKVFLKGSSEVSDVKISNYDNSAIDRNGDLKDGLYLYTIDSDGYYELTTPAMATQDFYVAGEVTRTYGSSIVLNKSDENNAGVNEFIITKDTIVIDNTDNPSTPTAIANGSIAKGDKVALLENSDNQVYMIVIDNTEASVTPPPVTGSFTGTSTIGLVGDTLTYTYHASKYSISDFRTTLADALNVTADKITNVNLSSGTVVVNGDTYSITEVEMVAVQYSGNTVSYIKVGGSPTSVEISAANGTILVDKNAGVLAAANIAGNTVGATGKITLSLTGVAGTDMNFVPGNTVTITSGTVENGTVAILNGDAVPSGAKLTFVGSAGTYVQVTPAAGAATYVSVNGNYTMAGNVTVVEGYVKVTEAVTEAGSATGLAGSGITGVSAKVTAPTNLFVKQGDTVTITMALKGTATADVSQQVDGTITASGAAISGGLAAKGSVIADTTQVLTAATTTITIGAVTGDITFTLTLAD